MRKKELWKEYPLEIDFEGYYKIEVSDAGNFRTYTTSFPQGKSVEGSVQAGYRILRSKLKKKWNERDSAKITEFNQQIENLNTQIKEKLKRKAFQEEVLQLRNERNKLIQKRKKLNTKLTNKNTINLAVLFHKAVAELFLEKPASEEYKFVIHKDFDKTNNVVENLAWATQEELDQRLTKHPKMILREFNKQFLDNTPKVKTSKLTEMDVLTIKKRLKRGLPLKKLAKQFGVSDMQIHRIKTGENWSHVKLIEDILEQEK